MRRKHIFVIVLGVYFLIGFVFTTLRANAHYDYFVVQEDFIGTGGKSYWENRCVEGNRERPFPYAQWCVDGSGEFKTEQPSKFSWYFHMYSKRPSDWFVAFFAWPLHFFGVDLIKFRSTGNAF